MADQRGSYDFAYEHANIPPGMTIGEWRTQQAAQHQRRVATSRRPCRRRRRPPTGSAQSPQTTTTARLLAAIARILRRCVMPAGRVRALDRVAPARARAEPTVARLRRAAGAASGAATGEAHDHEG